MQISNGVNQTYQQFGPTAIEALKAARNQVVRAESPEYSRGAESPERIRGADKSGNEDKADKSLTGFAEEFVQKLTSIEQEKAAVDEEIAKMEKIWLRFTEKKKQLEARSDELTKVKDKLKELDKEMTDFLSKRSPVPYGTGRSEL